MGPSGKLPIPSLSLLTPIFPRPKNSLAEDTFNNIFLIKKKKKKQRRALPSVRASCLAFPGGAGRGAVEVRGPGTLGAVGLLLLEQGHSQLRTAPQPLQVAEAAAVVEFLAEPRAAVPQ